MKRSQERKLGEEISADFAEKVGQLARSEEESEEQKEERSKGFRGRGEK